MTETSDLPLATVTFDGVCDIPAQLDRAGIDYVIVDEQRLLAIYLSAIFNVTVEMETITAAGEATVDCWEGPRPSFRSGQSAEDALDGLVDVLTQTPLPL